MKHVKNSKMLPSPALLFYEDAIRENFVEAVRIAGSPERLRPHIKTHKTAEIVSIAMSFGITKFKCATIAEAEMLARTGARDIFVAYTLVGRNAGRLVELAVMYPKVQFSVLVDTIEPAASIERLVLSAGIRIGAYLDLDVGQHRTGISPGTEAVELYRFIASCRGLYPAGLHCYDGHNHQHDYSERMAAAKYCYGLMESFRDQLLNAGLSVPEVVIGGTPTFPCYATMEGVMLSPGTCFLQDYSYASSFPDLRFKNAAVLFTRVISRNVKLKTFTLDLGYKGISSDPQGLRGLILDHEGSQPMLQNEEHWVFTAPKKGLPEIGEEVYVIPTHICPTVALYERAHIINTDGVCYTEWKIAARDRSIGI